MLSCPFLCRSEVLVCVVGKEGGQEEKGGNGGSLVGGVFRL